MKRTNKPLSFSFIIMGFVLILTTNCKKDTTTTPTPPSGNGFIFNPNLSYGSMTDIDGNVYKTIKIGTQTWMAENLKVTHYRNSDKVYFETNNINFAQLKIGSYCNFNNDASISMIYGKLYNWHAINDIRKIAPIGWHVPSDNEWKILTEFLGGDSIAGGKLKEIGTSHWSDPNIGATNEVGFTAVPCGAINNQGSFSTGNIGNSASWWTSSQYGTNLAIDRKVSYKSSQIQSPGENMQAGRYIRCIKD